MNYKVVRRNRGMMKNVLILVVLALLVALALPGPAQAEVIEVPCQLGADLALTLAIQEANSNPGKDTIRLEGECTYGLFATSVYDEGHNGLPVITDELTIEGNGARLERMSGNIRFRLIKATAPLTIEDLTLVNGYADDPNDQFPRGGAIFARNDLALRNVSVEDSRTDGPGGGVFVTDGDLTAINSHFENNEAVNDSGGGLFAEYGEALLYATTFVNNRAKDFGGGAVIAQAPAIVDESQFTGNSLTGANRGGAALYFNGTDATVHNTTFIDNSAPDAYGGALYARSMTQLVVAESYFEHNAADRGGAIYSADGRITVLRSTLLRNEASTGAALYLIMKDGSNSLLVNNLWVGNKSGNAQQAIEVTAPFGYVAAPHVNFMHNTIADSPVGNATAIKIGRGVATVVNNIVAGYEYGLANIGGTVSAGHNLYEVSDFANAQLGAIQPFGDGTILIGNPGFVNRGTGNYRLQGDSLAIDAGYTVSVSTDLESNSRPQGDGYDIGAYEYVPQNVAPVAKNDGYVTQEDKALTVAAPGVLGNDEDDDGDALTARLESLPQHGALTLQANGGFTYAPDKGYVGQDSFTYRAYDGEDESNVAAVTITVEDVNEAPVARNDSYATLQDKALTIAAPGVLDNDEDADGDNLTAVLRREPDHGALTLNANGSFTYTPDGGYSGTDSFRYQARDGQANSNTATVTITVEEVDTNVAPVAVGDNYEVDEGTTLTVAAPGVLGNDGDANGDALTAALASGVDHGQLTLNANGSFSYTPDAGYVGQDAFTYRASDGQENSNAATVTIEVRDVNEAPVAVSDSYQALEDTELAVGAPGVLDNDSDGDGDSLTARLDSLPNYGTVTLAADGSFTYSADEGYVGQDSFTYRAYDGKDESNVATVTIEVQDVNEAPEARDDRYATLENTALTVGAPGVLDNDSDEDDDALTAELEREPAYGTVTLNDDGSFTYTPESGYVGEDSFAYRAYDGTESSNEATVTVDVEPAGTNLPPVAVGDTYETEPNTELSVAAPGVLDNDGDANGDALTALLVSGPAYGQLALNADGSFTYTPDKDFAGEDSFTYWADDGVYQSNEATVRIWVLAEQGPEEPLTESIFLPVFVK